MNKPRRNLSASVAPRGKLASGRINSIHETVTKKQPTELLDATGNLYSHSEDSTEDSTPGTRTADGSLSVHAIKFQPVGLESRLTTWNSKKEINTKQYGYTVIR